jgi:hypothetical protein
VYEAIAFAPRVATFATSALLQPARLDVAVLVETESPGTIGALRESTAGQTLVDYLTENSHRVHAVAARNIKRVGDVDKSRPGTFLFNYFVSDDPDVVVELRDYLAGWYQVETGLNNSTLLAPLESEPSEFVVVNHFRWDGSLLSVILKQLGKKSFRSYVLGNLDAHHVGAMPILYRRGCDQIGVLHRPQRKDDKIFIMKATFAPQRGRRVSNPSRAPGITTATTMIVLLQHRPASVGRVLDIGCRAGCFARRLAEEAEQVDARAAPRSTPSLR